jgi:hypothetical protein
MPTGTMVTGWSQPLAGGPAVLDAGGVEGGGHLLDVGGGHDDGEGAGVDLGGLGPA